MQTHVRLAHDQPDVAFYLRSRGIAVTEADDRPAAVRVKAAAQATSAMHAFQSGGGQHAAAAMPVSTATAAPSNTSSAFSRLAGLLSGGSVKISSGAADESGGKAAFRPYAGRAAGAREEGA